MSQAPEMGQGERTLSRAAGLVADAKADFDGLSKSLEQQILAQQGRWVGAGGSAFFTLHRRDPVVELPPRRRPARLSAVPREPRSE